VESQTTLQSRVSVALLLKKYEYIHTHHQTVGWIMLSPFVFFNFNLVNNKELYKVVNYDYTKD